jgi:hypothetical protein
VPTDKSYVTHDTCDILDNLKEPVMCDIEIAQYSPEFHIDGLESTYLLTKKHPHIEIL